MERKIQKRPARKKAAAALAVLAAALLFAVNHTPFFTGLREAPEAVFAESEDALNARLEWAQRFSGLTVSAASSSDETLGKREIDCSLFGAVTLKKIPAYIGERPYLVPGGQAVGISIHTEGVLVVGVGSVTGESGRRFDPASEAGVKPGDVIVSVNGAPVNDSKELKDMLDATDGSALLLIERDGRSFEVSVPVIISEDGSRRIGAWVRDSTVGIGTLSFYDAGTGDFAALGHAVADADTGELLKVRDGKLVIASILGVTKGRRGAPGELHGTFDGASTVLGSVKANSELGISGGLYPDACAAIGGEAIPVAFPDEVHTGAAVLIASADGERKEYSCRIVKTGRQDAPAEKGIVIEVTDDELIGLTGGIVQGMSGSPVIQDGKLIGAVTHVFVNDPQKGYGAYAYWMYKRLLGV